ncbi:MAG TPA: D-ribose pyranase [Patescibacteria group bacterium]|jgi:D-ribose pyranase|nr:D-ribose pyranase [Clostridia bacterium]HYE10318.1 D-ribose pyranase [Patescibacteria group bacterium]
MKKGVLMNSEISYVISKLGHGDSIVIGDSGLPIPDSCKRIDLAVSKGIPGFLDVLDAVLSEQRVEEIALATELKQINPLIYQGIINRMNELENSEGYKINVKEVAHEDFKALNKTAKAIIRTGECTPYANILLKSGVVF